MHELTFVLVVVVRAQEQIAISTFLDEHAEQYVGLGTAPIAAISCGENDRVHGCSSVLTCSRKCPTG